MKYENLNKNYISGVWRDGNSDRTVVTSDPYTGEVMATFKAASFDDLNEAYVSAEKVQKDWEKTNPYRINEIFNNAVDIMKKRYDEILELIIKESGSTKLKAHVELDSCIRATAHSASFPFHMDTIMSRSLIDDKMNYTVKRPVGVVGVIGPYNFPMYLAVRSVAPAIAAGNTVVLKPSSTTAIVGGTIIAKIFEEAGLPAGVLSVIVPTTSEIGDAFYDHPIPQVISFTGSTGVGRRIGEIAGRNIKKTMLELGGNNAMVVLDDADVDYAVRSAVFGRFLHSGQICMSTNRIIVDESIFDEFAKKYVELTKTLNVGDPKEMSTLVGPLITEREAIRVVEWVEKARAEGAKVLLEGKREGAVVYPYVIEGTNDTFTARNEMFGPVATLIRAKNEEEALFLANDTDAGLSGAVHTANRDRGYKFASRWDTGMVHINDQTVNDEPNVAFGGEKTSGLGRFGRLITLDEVTTYKWISDQTVQRQLPV